MGIWFRNKRIKGHSRWHYDNTPEAPDFIKRWSVDIKCLPLSLCKTANRELMLEEVSKDQPNSDCCPLCLKELERLNMPALALFNEQIGGMDESNIN